MMNWQLICGPVWLVLAIGCSNQNYIPKHPPATSELFGIGNDDSVSPSTSTTAQQDTTPPRIILHNPQLDEQRGITPTPKITSAQTTLRGQAIDESGVAKVTINGKEAALNASGHFSAPLRLKPGKNPLHITATDIHGNQANKNLSIERKTNNVVQSDESQKLSTGRYYALVIGINRYQHNIPQLKTAVNDAVKVADVLKKQYGFTITTLLDRQATREEILGKLEILEETLGKNDNLLIYYAGHGYFDKKRQKAYWQPVDANEFRHTWIIADSITSSLFANAARNILIVSDSCYSGTLERGWTPTPKTNRHRYLQQMLNKRSRLLLASGGNEPVSDSGGIGHSIFAKHFLKGLRNISQSAFTAEELFKKYIKEPVQFGSDQTPQFQPIHKSGHEAGDFVFQKR
ncbi:MAG: hypothetical protein DRR08_26235 [Candidatus Parabeggiatoa sp. nov. 2]|nr:MAG: hypothetical protein DRR08_26235 [Gammaproteobacteria bacterium]